MSYQISYQTDVMYAHPKIFLQCDFSAILEFLGIIDWFNS